MNGSHDKVGKTRDGRTSVTVKIGKTCDGNVRDIYVMVRDKSLVESPTCLAWHAVQ